MTGKGPMQSELTFTFSFKIGCSFGDKQLLKEVGEL